MSINKLVSIKNPIIDARDMLGLDHSADDPVFTRWATQAEKAINSLPQMARKRKVLTIDGCAACLPPDARYVQRAVLGDLGEGCEDLFNNLCAQLVASTFTSEATTTFLIVDMGTSYNYIVGSIPHQIQDNKIILNSDYNGQFLTIQYVGYMTDEEGFIKVGENHVEAIKWYLVWMYWFRKRNIAPMEYGKMKDAKLEWNRECSNARALDNALTESERNVIVDMLHDPWIGIGLELQPTL